jgi:hypothetical protein
MLTFTRVVARIYREWGDNENFCKELFKGEGFRSFFLKNPRKMKKKILLRGDLSPNLWLRACPLHPKTFKKTPQKK